MTQPLLQCQLTHARVPHPRGMRMSQRVRRNPRLMDAGAAARSRKQFREGRIAQRLGSTLATTADQKQEWAATIRRSVCDHILVEGGEGCRLVEIDDALESRLCPHALRMIVAASDDNATMSIADILELERQHFAGTQPTVQHQPH